MTPFQKRKLEELKNTKLGKSGGSCFECCDYEEIYSDTEAFLLKALQEQEELLKRNRQI